ncbi:MAG: serine hydrolase [Flavobacteriales bacterium]|nr:serine hydrolase [Flavobacteriales bacterium]
MTRLLLLPLLLLPLFSHAQTYYPPNTGGEWETVDPESLGWCTEAIPELLSFLDTNNTKAFLVLKDGRIAIEAYFDSFTQDSLWYWASAGKSLTAFMVGLAQEDGFLDIDEATSTYLGEGWTNCTPEQEAAITVRDQLNMTTGLDDGVADSDCTDPECLQFLADPGTRWAYHNAPYTLLDGVIANATGTSLNSFLVNELTLTTGLAGLYLPVGYNNVFFSTPRSMARFGLLAMSGGVWNGNVIMEDQDYFNAMVSPSQTINPAYGHLWWLNGQQSYMLPGLQLSIPGMIMPNAPPEAFNAMGKNGQFINVVPSQGLVMVRMGSLPGSSLFVPNFFNDDIWVHLNAVMCMPNAIDAPAPAPGLTLFPNPAAEVLTLTLPSGASEGELRIVDTMGRVLLAKQVRTTTEHIDLRDLAPGSYRCLLTSGNGRVVEGFVKE